MKHHGLDDFILQNYQTMTDTQMAAAFPCDRKTIRAHKHKLGIQTMSERNAQLREQTDYICSQYGKKNKTILSQELSCSPAFIAKIWSENGLSGSISTVYYSDETVFDMIDTPEKAYWLGFIAADGCVYRREGHQAMLAFGISTEDEEILVNFKNFLHSEKPISRSKDKRRESYMSNLQITSNHLCDALRKLGINSQKTWALDMNTVLNSIPTKFFGAFLHGYLDGDGSITCVNTQDAIARCRISIVGPMPSLQALAEHSAQWYVPGTIKQTSPEKYKLPFGALNWQNTTLKYAILKLMYWYDIPCLTRKKERAYELMRRIEKNITNRSENKDAIKNYQSVVEKWEELLGA